MRLMPVGARLPCRTRRSPRRRRPRQARKAQATDTKTAAAILALAAAVNDTRGDTPVAVVDTARAAGVTDQELAKTIGHVALNVLTNCFNKAARVEIDFPVVTA